MMTITLRDGKEVDFRCKWEPKLDRVYLASYFLQQKIGQFIHTNNQRKKFKFNFKIDLTKYLQQMKYCKICLI